MAYFILTPNIQYLFILVAFYMDWYPQAPLATFQACRRHFFHLEMPFFNVCFTRLLLLFCQYLTIFVNVRYCARTYLLYGTAYCAVLRTSTIRYYVLYGTYIYVHIYMYAYRRCAYSVDLQCTRGTTLRRLLAQLGDATWCVAQELP